MKRLDVILYVGSLLNPVGWCIALIVLLYAHWKLHVTRHECAPVELKFVSDRRRRSL